MKFKFFQVSERAGQAVAALQEPGHGVQRADGAEAGPGHRHDHHQGPLRRLQGHLAQAGKFRTEIILSSIQNPLCTRFREIRIPTVQTVHRVTSNRLNPDLG